MCRERYLECKKGKEARKAGGWELDMSDGSVGSVGGSSISIIIVR